MSFGVRTRLWNFLDSLPWVPQLVRSLTSQATNRMADLGALLFHSPDQEEEPSPDELFVGEELSPEERLEHFSKSDLVLHRLFVLRDLLSLAEELGFEGSSQHIVPVLRSLSDDPEPMVRAVAMEQSFPLCSKLLSENREEGYRLVAREIAPIVISLLMDKNLQTQANAHEAFVSIAGLFTKEDMHAIAFPEVEGLVCNSTEEDFRVEGLSLMNDFAPVFSKFGMLDLIVPKVLDSRNDPSFRVRKGCVEVLSALCTHLPSGEVSEKLLPAYMELCKDKIWGVRKACAVALPSFAKRLSPEQRAADLMQVFLYLNEDVSRWVKSAALEALGPFIATFLGDLEVPSVLVDCFERMSISDPELVLACAFNFPAVVLTLGEPQWPRLRSIFARLSGDMQWKVRRTLSFSIHELAKILGNAITEEDLAPVFDLYLRDLDDVKVGVMTHFTDFLVHLHPDTREIFLERVSEQQQQRNEWHFREILARQLGMLSEHSTEGELERQVINIGVRFTLDTVNQVRTAALPGLAALFRNVKARCPPEALLDLANQYKKLATHHSFTYRQCYAELCGVLGTTIDQQDFQAHFLPLFISLGYDPVPNVRIMVAKTITQHLSKIELYRDHRGIAGTLERLRYDEDEDVVQISNA